MMEQMNKGRFSEEQMVGILRKADRSPVALVAKKLEIGEQTIYFFRKPLGGMSDHDVKRLRLLKRENTQLKKILAELDIEISHEENHRNKKVGALVQCLRAGYATGR